jgi:hypothetical protein
MKKVIATLIAGLFVSAAFAQAPATPVTKAAAAKEVAKTDTKESKAMAKDTVGAEHATMAKDDAHKTKAHAKAGKTKPATTAAAPAAAAAPAK